MAGRGFDYSTPEDLWNSLAAKLDSKHTPAAGKLEIKVALADYRCAGKVALLSTVHTLQTRHAKYFSKALAGSLAKITRIEARAIKITKGLHLHLPAKR
jgi:hypothetical protein